MPSTHFDETAYQGVMQAVNSKYPLIYVVSSEEERIERVMNLVSAEHYQDDRKAVHWTASRGFNVIENSDSDFTDPVAALQYISDHGKDAIYLLKDLPGFFEREHRIERVLRDLYTGMTDRNCFVVMSYPLLELPPVLKKELYVVEFGLPTQEDISSYLNELLVAKGVAASSVDKIINRGSAGLRGLSFEEIKHLFSRIMSGPKPTIETVLQDIYEEKAQVLKKESCLVVVPGEFDVDSIGGLENLKKWVNVRGALFTREASNAGILPPSGVLFMGVSGCGKSLAAKTIASAWKLPLIRLDMGLVMSGVFGPPEFAFDRAIRIVESIAPLVLWIDEIENSFGYDDDMGSGGNVNIFSTFLTWMQEKPSNVFVAATANRIQKLPAEMIRKGRFDQVFYVDLPNENERREILVIHIEKNNSSATEVELETLVTMTEGWSGAEIEQSVNAAKVDAFNENRECSYRDILFNVGKNVPLSKTMREQVEALRSWSIGRTTPASSNVTVKKRFRGAGMGKRVRQA